MRVDLLRYADLDMATLCALREIRDAGKQYDSPFFDLEFVHQLSLVRDDTRILVLYEEDGPAGYWAMHVRPDKWTRPIGAAFSDWHGPVLRSDFAHIDPDKLLGLAGLKGMTVNGLLNTGPSGAVAATLEVAAVGQAVIDAGGAEAFLTNQRQRFPKYAKNIRRAERLIENDFKGMTFVADDRSADALDWLLESKSAQYNATGLHDVLGPLWVQSLMRNLHGCESTRFAGRLSTLRFGNELVAAEFDLISDTIVHGWITVFDHEYARYSPGHLLIREIICDMERTGHSINDMGTGNSAYKKYYETVAVAAHAGTVRSGRGLRPLAAGWRFAEKALPQKLSGTLASIRRRTDQIAGTELDSGQRIAGFRKAVLGKRKTK